MASTPNTIFEVGENELIKVWKTWLTEDGLIVQWQERSDSPLEFQILKPFGSGHLTLRRVRKIDASVR
jgi:hypothetical protein